MSPNLQNLKLQVKNTVIKVIDEIDTVEENDNANTLIDKVVKALQLVGMKDEQECKRAKVEGEEEAEELQICPQNLFKSDEEKVLNNPLLLKMILQRLDPTTLKRCRLLNSIWNQLSSEALTSEKCLQLTLEFEAKYRCYFLKVKYDGSSSNSMTLAFLNEILEKAAGFPVTNLYLRKGLSINDDFSSFLLRWGSKLRGLKLSYAGHRLYLDDRLNYLRQLLFDYAPYVETLHFEDTIPASWNPLVAHGHFQTRPLPYLKTLHFTCHVESNWTFFKEILKAAVNLEQVCYGGLKDNFLKLDAAGALIQTNKFHLITRIEDRLGVNHLDVFDLISNSTPEIRLERLKLAQGYDGQVLTQEHRQRIAQAFSKILKSSSSTMTFLSLEFRLCSQPSEIIIPPMTVLKALSLEWEGNDRSQDNFPSMLPHQFLMSTSFPVLHTVNLDFSNSSTQLRTKSFESILPFLDEMETVNYFRLTKLPNEDWLIRFAQIFPNLKGLSLQEIEKFPYISTIIWTHFQNIQILELDINCGYGHSENLFPQLEASFTGFSKGICKKLRSNPGSVKNLEDKRKNPSIINLKCLKELEITLIVDNHSLSTSDRLFSHVTGRFAFALMNGLRPKITSKSHRKFDFLNPLFAIAFRSSLNSLSPYADIIV